MRIETIRQVALAAPDLDASVDFYENTLGATLMAKYDQAGLAFFDLSGIRLMLEKRAAPATLYYWVDDLEGACEELKSAGVAIESEPHMIFKDDAGTFGDAGGEEWMAFVKDPAGNMVGLATRK